MQENQGVFGWIVLPALLALAHVWIVALWIITSDERIPVSQKRPWIFALVFLNLIAGAAFILRRVFEVDRRRLLYCTSQAAAPEPLRRSDEHASGR